ncbi:MAG: hypothetical protein FWG25_10850, partial [Promicromonosporaceae bacterium]|nr:hypothetical protein [Promicromonosporaceae bacterium]
MLLIRVEELAGGGAASVASPAESRPAFWLSEIVPNTDPEVAMGRAPLADGICDEEGFFWCDGVLCPPIPEDFQAPEEDQKLGDAFGVSEAAVRIGAWVHHIASLPEPEPYRTALLGVEVSEWLAEITSRTATRDSYMDDDSVDSEVHLNRAERHFRYLLENLEKSKAALAALQLEAMVSLNEVIRRREVLAGLPKAERGKGVTRQIGQAIHQSETHASRLLSAAHVLTEAMP